MHYARRALASESDYLFAHRYITRPADAGQENHVALSAEEFSARCAANLFAMHWSSHGLRYGIGIEIEQWLDRDMTVVINGSRAYLPEAQMRYPHLVPILVEVPEALLRQRLIERGRESINDIEQRLQRNRTLRAQVRLSHIVMNDGALSSAGDKLVDLIRSQRAQQTCA